MNTRATYLFVSIAGPILVIAGLASLFGFGIPDPFGLWALVIGTGFIVFSQRQAKRFQDGGKQTGFVPASSEQKKRNFWILVMAAALGAGTSAFWLPGANPGIPPMIFWISAVASFAMCVIISWYFLIKGKP
jgi:hypothetical protein